MFKLFDELSFFVEANVPEWMIGVILIPIAVVGYSLLFPVACIIWGSKKIAELIDD